MKRIGQSETYMAENTQIDISRLTFERAIEELETIVKRLEDGKVPLEESVTIYERGEALKRRCEELLRQAEARVDKITTDASGQATSTAPLDVQEGPPSKPPISRSAHRQFFMIARRRRRCCCFDSREPARAGDHG